MSSMEAKLKPQKTQNPEMNSDEKTSSETTLSDSNSSDKKSVTLSSSSNNSNFPSFSKLLQGVVLAANSVLSSDSSVKTSDFQGQFAMSHQEALADVTAKAAQAHPQTPKSLIKPLPTEKVDELEKMKRNSSFHTDEPSDGVPRTPKLDGYSWRKYGQKQVKSSGSSRSYYRCTNLSCSAKKKVQHVDVSGQIIEVVYKGDHNHDPPQILKGSNRKKDSTPRALKNSSDSSVQYLDSPHSRTCERECKELVASPSESQNINQKSAAGTPPAQRDEEVHAKPADTPARPESELTIVPVVEEHSVSRSDSSNELAMIDPMKEPDVMPLKKRRIRERGKACSESVYRTFKDPKIVVHADGDTGSSDGYRWRKYGQKMVKGTPHPRSYYRCSSAGCPVRKHVERATDNSTAIIVTYEGKHDHEIPVPKKHHQQALPNSVNATASGANMLDKSESKSLPQGSAEEQSKVLDSSLGEEKSSEAAGDKVLESARTLLSIGIELKSC